jgi:hypothetical protein
MNNAFKPGELVVFDPSNTEIYLSLIKTHGNIFRSKALIDECGHQEVSIQLVCGKNIGNIIQVKKDDLVKYTGINLGSKVRVKPLKSCRSRNGEENCYFFNGNEQGGNEGIVEKINIRSTLSFRVCIPKTNVNYWFIENELVPYNSIIESISRKNRKKIKLLL